MPRATRIPRESLRTTTTSLYDSELLRRSFSLESADSVSEAELIPYCLSEKQMGNGKRKSARSMMDYGFSQTLSSRLHDIVKGRIGTINGPPFQTVEAYHFVGSPDRLHAVRKILIQIIMCSGIPFLNIRRLSR